MLVMMPLLVASALAVEQRTPVTPTCLPSNNCFPTMPALPPQATPIVRWAQGHCGTLVANVYLLNETTVPVPSNPQLWDLALVAGGRTLHPVLTTADPVRSIAPGAFLGPVRYSGAIPRDLTGTGMLTSGPEPAIQLLFDTANPCRPADG